MNTKLILIFGVVAVVLYLILGPKTATGGVPLSGQPITTSYESGSPLASGISALLGLAPTNTAVYTNGLSAAQNATADQAIITSINNDTYGPQQSPQGQVLSLLASGGSLGSLDASGSTGSFDTSGTFNVDSSPFDAFD